MTWEIFLGIAALASFVLLLITPISKLTKAVTELSCEIKALNQNQSDTKTRVDAHGKQIDDHETRIVKCEERLKKTEEKVNYFHDV